MSFSAFFWHLANFLAPAVAMAVLLAAGPRLMPKARRAGFWREAAWLSLAGAGVLLAGLVWFGRDGKMATYAALVLVQGTVAWFLRRRGVR